MTIYQKSKYVFTFFSEKHEYGKFSVKIKISLVRQNILKTKAVEILRMQ